jgi:hypothetical protein
VFDTRRMAPRAFAVYIVCTCLVDGAFSFSSFKRNSHGPMVCMGVRRRSLAEFIVLCHIANHNYFVLPLFSGHHVMLVTQAYSWTGRVTCVVEKRCIEHIKTVKRPHNNISLPIRHRSSRPYPIINLKATLSLPAPGPSMTDRAPPQYPTRSSQTINLIENPSPSLLHPTNSPSNASTKTNTQNHFTPTKPARSRTYPSRPRSPLTGRSALPFLSGRRERWGCACVCM